MDVDIDEPDGLSRTEERVVDSSALSFSIHSYCVESVWVILELKMSIEMFILIIIVINFSSRLACFLSTQPRNATQLHFISLRLLLKIHSQYIIRLMLHSWRVNRWMGCKSVCVDCEWNSLDRREIKYIHLSGRRNRVFIRLSAFPLLKESFWRWWTDRRTGMVQMEE